MVFVAKLTKAANGVASRPHLPGFHSVFPFPFLSCRQTHGFNFAISYDDKMLPFCAGPINTSMHSNSGSCILNMSRVCILLSNHRFTFNMIAGS